MKRLAVLLLIGVVPVPFVTAGIPTRYFTVSCKGGLLHVRDGKPCVGTVSTDADKEAPDHWFLGGNSIKSSVGAGYLAYDPTGKSDKIFLSTKFGSHTEWQIVQTRGKTPGDRDEVRATIRAANGPMKGWEIDVKDGQLILNKTATRPAQANRVVLHL
jgi:hypothetical protein